MEQTVEQTETSQAESQPNSESNQSETNAKTEQKPTLVKIKVDGEESEVEINELRRKAQRAIAADKRFEESARIKKESEAFRSKLKEKPIDALLEAGVEKAELQKVMENWLLERIEEAQLDPKEKEIRDLKKWREDRERNDNETKQRAEKELIEAESAKWMPQLTTSIKQSLDVVGLPETTFVVQKVARNLKNALANDVPDYTVDDAVDDVLHEYVKDARTFVDSLSIEELSQFLGESNLKKLNDRLVKSADVQLGNRVTSEKQPRSTKAKPDPNQRTLSKEDWKKMILERARS